MIKASQVLKTVEKLGKKHPKRTRSCKYFKKNGQPCCIVGVALLKQGLDPAPFLESDTLNAGTNVRHLFSESFAFRFNLVNDLTNDDMDRLVKIQGNQDDGYTWGEAISE